jgi:hypothetical protein
MFLIAFLNGQGPPDTWPPNRQWKWGNIWRLIQKEENMSTSARIIHPALKFRKPNEADSAQLAQGRESQNHQPRTGSRAFPFDRLPVEIQSMIFQQSVSETTVSFSVLLT